MTRYEGEAPFSLAILMGISGLCVGALVGYILATAPSACVGASPMRFQSSKSGLK